MTYQGKQQLDAANFSTIPSLSLSPPYLLLVKLLKHQFLFITDLAQSL